MSEPGPGERRAEALRQRLGLSYVHIVGLRFAVNVFIASALVWFTLRVLDDTNPIWAIASMVAASDPEPVEARRMFRSRLINVLVGCALGLLFLLGGNRSEWLLPFALAVAVLVSTWIVRIKTMWRQAPITAAVIIAAVITSGSAQLGLQRGLHKVGEVVFGCMVGLLVSLSMSRLWLIRIPDQGAAAWAPGGKT